MAISPDDQLVANGDKEGKIVIRENEGNGRVKYSILVGDGVSVQSVSFSPNGEKLLCGTADQNGIRAYDVESGQLILGPIKLEGHENGVRSVLWSPDGSQFFSACMDHTIRCWNSDTGEPIGQPWTGHSDAVNSLSLSPDGTKIASASWDETVRFWDARSGEPIGQPLQHESSLWPVTFSPSGEFVASGTYSGQLSIWRVPWWDDAQKKVIYQVRLCSTTMLTTFVTPDT
jgi:WD40 repeat protein